jgi:hypothetical protein
MSHILLSGHCFAMEVRLVVGELVTLEVSFDGCWHERRMVLKYG